MKEIVREESAGLLSPLQVKGNPVPVQSLLMIYRSGSLVMDLVSSIGLPDSNIPSPISMLYGFGTLGSTVSPNNSTCVGEERFA